MGGVEMEIGVLFADVRGFTALAETMAPAKVADLLNDFYGCAAEVLARSAVIDKLVGDEVMALYIPQLLGERWEDEMIRDAADLLTAAGFDGGSSEAWLPLGIGLDLGRAFVGNVGSGEVKDFTALGDVVNTAARLQSSAQAGQIVFSERLLGRLSSPIPDARPLTLALKGKREAESAHVIDRARTGRMPERV
jgi:adenylate cyclase